MTMDSKTTAWQCPCCSISFSGPGDSVDKAIEGHAEGHERAILPSVLSLAGAVILDLNERICKIDDCGKVALYRVTVSSECEHEQAEPSELCEEHKTKACHPSYRMTCTACLDSRIHQDVYISEAALVYQDMITEGIEYGKLI